MLEGELAVEVADRMITLAAGDAASYPGDRPHTYANRSRNSSRFSLVVVDPGAASPARGGPPTPAIRP